jgi:hypothetical protein
VSDIRIRASPPSHKIARAIRAASWLVGTDLTASNGSREALKYAGDKLGMPHTAGQRAPPSASYRKEPSQSHCAAQGKRGKPGTGIFLLNASAWLRVPELPSSLSESKLVPGNVTAGPRQR